MYRKQVNERSPLRILESSIHGGLGRGNLGVVIARAGVGKTACLVQIGLDDLMRERRVLHIALGGQTLDHVQSWYDALFDDLADLTGLSHRQSVRASLTAHRIIRAHERLDAEVLEEAVALFVVKLGFKPDAILVDDFEWTDRDAEGSTEQTGPRRDPTRQLLLALKAAAEQLNAELWITARSHREEAEIGATGLIAPCDRYADLIDVALYLYPEANYVNIRLLKDHDVLDPRDTTLRLQCDTLRLVDAEDGLDHRDAPAAGRLPTSTLTLLSGGARGAEAEFGRSAERWGLKEINFSFEGRPIKRQRGVVWLSDEELQRGAVSKAYLKAHMHRSYPDTPLFRKVLQTIWHQVNTAGEVFVVGVVNEDGTVKGGTGWAAELAKHTRKPVHVFDQERNGWLVWESDRWVACEAPLISRRRFTGTGTRNLSDAGRDAIQALFERSFGPV